MQPRGFSHFLPSFPWRSKTRCQQVACWEEQRRAEAPNKRAAAGSSSVMHGTTLGGDKDEGKQGYTNAVSGKKQNWARLPCSGDHYTPATNDKAHTGFHSRTVNRANHEHSGYSPLGNTHVMYMAINIESVLTNISTNGRVGLRRFGNFQVSTFTPMTFLEIGTRDRCPSLKAYALWT